MASRYSANRAALILLVLAAAGCAPEGTPGAERNASSAGGAMDHSAHGAGSMDSMASMEDAEAQLLAEPRFGTATADLLAVAEDGSEVTVRHSAFDGIEMGAMTMAFDVAESVARDALPEAGRVALRVRQNRNYTYELVAICPTTEDSVACLESEARAPATAP
ncbi:MAG: copper-binding protein [Pseudomonadota bacterium]